MPLFSLEQDPKKATEGVPTIFPHYDCRITIARSGGHNAQLYDAVVSEVTEPFRRAIELGVLDQEKDRELTFLAYARAVVKRWETRWASLPQELQDKLRAQGTTPQPDGFVRGIDWRGEELLPDTPDHIVRVFQALPDLFVDVRVISREMKAFALQGREAAAKN